MAKPLSTSSSNVSLIFTKAIIFIVLAWFLSGVAYYGLNYMYMNSYGGNSGAQINHLIRTQYDIYVFGASRASHHYDPEVIGAKLGMKCYNAGDDGKNATYQLGLLQMLLKKHTPKLIIYEAGDFSPFLDSGTVDLFPYYYLDEDVKNILIQRDKWASIKFLFPLYAYNRKVLTVVKGFVQSSPPYSTGFRPLSGTMHPAEEARLKSKSHESDNDDAIDRKSLVSFKEFIRTCKDNHVTLILCYSPTYLPSKPQGIDFITNIARKEGLPFFMFGEDARYNYNPKFFRDAGHLNSSGASMFSHEVCEFVR